MGWWSTCSYDAFSTALTSFDLNDPAVTSFVAMISISTLCFVVSTITGNASQVDKIWSITPWLYA